MSVKLATRWMVLERDNFTCRYCGAHAPDEALQVDHVVPVSKGGSDKMSNLVTACWYCNQGKRARNGRPGLSRKAFTERRIADLESELAEARALADRRGCALLADIITELLPLLRGGEDEE